MSLKLRGYHLVCLHFFTGEGYNPAFIKNLKDILTKINAGEEIEVCKGPDDICEKCPFLKNKKCLYNSNAEQEIREMDEHAENLLGIKSDTKLLWSDINKRVRKIFIQWSSLYCRSCNWRNVCEKVDLYKKALQ